MSKVNAWHNYTHRFLNVSGNTLSGHYMCTTKLTVRNRLTLRVSYKHGQS